ncbi:hypothetical protein QBC39DRAFT_334288 [Podospora conica]|nr:hypothetical protein QBC39DRAFT_334288 [Schizothecium conicum]
MTVTVTLDDLAHTTRCAMTTATNNTNDDDEDGEDGEDEEYELPWRGEVGNETAREAEGEVGRRIWTMEEEAAEEEDGQHGAKIAGGGEVQSLRAAVLFVEKWETAASPGPWWTPAQTSTSALLEAPDMLQIGLGRDNCVAGSGAAEESVVWWKWLRGTAVGSGSAQGRQTAARRGGREGRVLQGDMAGGDGRGGGGGGVGGNEGCHAPGGALRSRVVSGGGSGTGYGGFARHVRSGEDVGGKQEGCQATASNANGRRKALPKSAVDRGRILGMGIASRRSISKPESCLTLNSWMAQGCAQGCSPRYRGLLVLLKKDLTAAPVAELWVVGVGVGLALGRECFRGRPGMQAMPAMPWSIPVELFVHRAGSRWCRRFLMESTW